jgi:peptidylprolyl isomerase
MLRTFLLAALTLGIGCGDSGSAKTQYLGGPVEIAVSADKAPPFTPLDEKKMKTTDSGLKLKDVKTGEGEEAKAGTVVQVHYTGWLTDGKKFDSSLDRGRPFTLILGAGQVIKGWDEGVAGMKEGGKRRLQIPPELGYGERGAGKDIPPGATLVFEIDLLKVKPGVKIEDLKAGEGPAAKRGDTVQVHYTGKLTSGKQFDSSVGKDPFSFKLGAKEVIAGWDVGVAGMKVGGKRKLTIAPELGYGEDGAGDDIPPNATLVFEVELLKIR